MQEKEIEVEIVPTQESIMEVSMRLHSNRKKLRQTMVPAEYDHVAPLIEQRTPYILRAELFRMVTEAYIGGACFDYVSTLTEVLRVCQEWKKWKEAKQ